MHTATIRPRITTFSSSGGFNWQFTAFWFGYFVIEVIMGYSLISFIALR